jgi:hypothetical protein
LEVWKFGVLVPRTHAQAVELDKKNGNTYWQDEEQLLEYGTFIDKDKGTAIVGYKRIRWHIIYDVKHDGRRKARLVAGGHLTDPNTNSVYSGVVSLRGIRLIIFNLSEHQKPLFRSRFASRNPINNLPCLTTPTGTMGSRLW